jgi:allene oxide cyclase
MKPNALVLGSIALASCAAASAASAAEVLHVVEHADTDAVTDTGAKNDSAGDILTFANPVFDQANAKKIGTNQGYCVRTVGTGKYSAARGQMKLHARNEKGSEYDFVYELE